MYQEGDSIQSEFIIYNINSRPERRNQYNNNLSGMEDFLSTFFTLFDTNADLTCNVSIVLSLNYFYHSFKSPFKMKPNTRLSPRIYGICLGRERHTVGEYLQIIISELYHCVE